MKHYRLLITALLGVGIASGIMYGIVHAGHKPAGPEAGMLEEVLVTAPRADRVVEEIVVTAEGPRLVLPVVEVRANRTFWTAMADETMTGEILVN